jgi:hypothetical protein
MRLAMLVLLLAVSTTSCRRRVVVTTPTPVPQVAQASLKVSNDAAQAVTVFVSYAGTEYTLGRVTANTTAVLAVAQVPVGAQVRLRAELADGSRSYTRDGVTLTTSYEWRVP